MAIKPPHGNHVIIEDVRVSYDKKTNSFHITAKDPDLEDGFHLTLNKGRKSENSLRKMMEKVGYVFPDGVDRIPTSLPGIDRPTDSPWNRVHLGKSEDSDTIWNTTLYPHAFIAGGTPNKVRQSILSSIVKQAISNPDKWEVQAIDLTATSFTSSEREKFSQFSEYLPDALQHLKNLKKEMESRLALKASAGPVRFADIPDAPKDIMVIIENASLLLDAPKYPSKLDKSKAEKQAQSLTLVKEILSRGAGVGIHIVISGNWFERDFLTKDFLSNFEARFILNRFPEWDSEMFLGNSDALTEIKHGVIGRCLAQFDNETVPFQAYTD